MITRKRLQRTAALAAVVAVSIGLAACGSDDDSGSDDTAASDSDRRRGTGRV